MGILTLSAGSVAKLRRARRRVWVMIGLGLLRQAADLALHATSIPASADAALASPPHPSRETLS